MPTLAADERERGPKRRRVFFPQDLRGTIDGRYRIIRPLETHGQGQVFEVFDNVKWRRIALKTWGTFDARGEFRLKKEFRSVRGIRHPNLVKLDLLGSDNALGVVYYTMEFVEGVDFLSHVRRRLPSSGAVCADLDRLRAALRQLVSGVHALHRHERLHRDLKPSNVLVTPEGRVVILDFGLVDQLNRTGNTLRTIALEGTVEYMAPEQVTEYHAMTPASDWYAVGVMIYEAVTGVLPIDGDSQIELLGRKQSITPKPMSTLVRDVPPQLDVLVSRLLQVDPRKRATPAQLLAWCFDEPAHVLDAMSTRDPRSSAEGVALIGRGEQALALREAFSRLGDREQSLVFVRGAAGSGKSAFVRRLLDEFEAHPDVVVLSARCYQNETVQYNAFDSMTEVLARFLNNLDEAELRALVPEPLTRLAQVFPVFDRVSGLTAGDNHESTPDFQELRRQAFLELKHLLYDLATRYRLVMFMDDLQWGDSDSALLLQELITSPYRPPMLLIGCYRGDAPESPMLRELTRLRARFDRSTRGAHLVLGPLLPEEATRVARSLLRDLGIDDRERAAAIARESAGNIALIRRLVDNARIHPSAARDTPCPSSLAEAVQDCLARLSARARQAFELVALAEAPVPHDVLAEAVSAEADSLAMIGELRDANLIEERGGDDGPVLRCLDTRLREVAVEALSEEQRRRGHEALARAFVKLQRGDVEVWARHLVAAGSRAEALEYATSAAYEAATAFAFDHAAQL
ncbi:MAG: protein kinase, partial [Myxococcales bacterium]|nr:protein kinase [Myxococcales bacterium]